MGKTYKLLLDGDLLQLQLVDFGLGRAQQHGRGEESALHRGCQPRLPRIRWCLAPCVFVLVMLRRWRLKRMGGMMMC